MLFLRVETNNTVINGLRVVTMIAPFPAKPRCAPLKNATLYMKNNIAGKIKYLNCLIDGSDAFFIITNGIKDKNPKKNRKKIRL